MHDHQHQDNDEHMHTSNKTVCETCTLDKETNCPTCTLEDALYSNCDHDHGHEHEKTSWIKTIIIGLAIGAGLGLEYFGIGGQISVIILISAMIVSGYQMAINGIKSLMRGKIGIDLLVTIAAIVATLLGEYQEGTLVVFLKDISLKLEIAASERARHAIEELMKLRPEVATIKKEGREETVPVDQVLPGEVFIVRPGDRIPLDGIVKEGYTTIDQSTMTGESMPVNKKIHDEVYAGTINLDGYIAVETKRASSESMLSNILRMVQEAEARRSPTETFVNRFARYYTPLIITLAILYACVPPLVFNAQWESSIYNSLALLVIGCPCALTIATPVAMVSAITSASRNGVLIKGSTYIEEIKDANTYAFDKTGTLTVGKPHVTDIMPFGISKEELLAVAMALEENSKHPIAEAVKKEASKWNIPLYETDEFLSSTGRGIEARIDGQLFRVGSQRLHDELGIEYPDAAIKKLETQGKTVIILSKETEVIGLIALMDQSRPTAKKAIEELRNQGINIIMLTGDNETTAEAIAKQVGFNGYRANLLPDEKLIAIEDMKASGKVVMVGDGVNDAPALAAANVGIAMGGLGSDIALETADIVLLEDDLTRLSYIQRLSNKTLGRIKENISLSVLIKLMIVVLAAMGTISLWLSVILGDVGLTLLVVLNSIRISGVKPSTS